MADLGLPGPAAGKGDKVIFVPPGYKDQLPTGYRLANSPSNKMLVGVRSLPVNGDVPAAIERIKTVKVHPLKPVAGWPEILEKAAKIANAQMRVESFGDRRADRVVWADRKWEWAAAGERVYRLKG